MTYKHQHYEFKLNTHVLSGTPIHYIPRWWERLISQLNSSTKSRGEKCGPIHLKRNWRYIDEVTELCSSNISVAPVLQSATYSCDLLKSKMSLLSAMHMQTDNVPTCHFCLGLCSSINWVQIYSALLSLSWRVHISTWSPSHCRWSNESVPSPRVIQSKMKRSLYGWMRGVACCFCGPKYTRPGCCLTPFS